MKFILEYLRDQRELMKRRQAALMADQVKGLLSDKELETLKGVSQRIVHYSDAHAILLHAMEGGPKPTKDARW